MLTNPLDVWSLFPVRKSGKQKQSFRDAVQAYAEGMGYAVTVEKGILGSKNLIMGDPRTAKYLVTAHYDTCARLPIPNFITPCNPLIFILYQLLLTVVMFLPPVVCGYLISLLTGDSQIGVLVAYVLLWVMILLMMVGPANKSNANDNTSGVVSVLEIARALPQECRGQVCFVLFDLEEAGLFGSAGYASKHKKEVKNQIVLNLDCVGDGDEILFFPTGKLKRDTAKITWLKTVEMVHGEKSIAVRDKGAAIYPSDQANFPYGVGIAAFHRSILCGLYCSRIHTPRDTILEEENVILLRDALIRLICGSAAE